MKTRILTRSKINQNLNMKSRRPLLMKANEQYCLDFGQKNIDPIRCITCGMLYVVGEESDEKQHAKYHSGFTAGIKWPAKCESVRKYYDDCSRVVSIRATEPKPVIDSINELLRVSADDMSAGTNVLKHMKPNTLLLVYITPANVIIGYVYVEIIQEAHDLVDYEASTLEKEPVQAECGVIYLWTHPSYRRRGVATKLVDVARGNLKKEKVIYRSRVAVCDPTEMAIPFFNSYMFHKRPVKVYQSELIGK